MANVALGKRILAAVVLACACAVLIALPAHALYQVHSEENVSGSEALGAIEVCCTVDASAIGEGVRASLVMVPDGSTVEDLLQEGIESSNSQNGIDAIHDYSYTSLEDYLADKTWTYVVYEAGSQNPGTHTTYDTEGTVSSSADVELTRYCSVVITVVE